MAKTINLKLTTAYDSKGVKAALADMQALSKALTNVGKGSGRSANPFDSFVKGAKVAESEIDKLVKAQAQAAKPPRSTSDPFAPLGVSATKAERAILQLASAQARLASAKGNPAAAVKTLSDALGKVNQSSLPAIRAMTQLQAAQNALDKSSRAASGGFQVLPRTLDGLSGPALTAAKSLGAVAIALAGLRSAAQAISVVADTEQNLNILQATVGANTDQMRAASAMAQQLGADLSLPATSAAGAASAMIELTRQGLSLEDSMAAAKGTLQLAAAGMISEGEAASYVAATLNQFKLNGDEAVHVADLLAASVAASGSGIAQTGQAVQQAGASFAAAGVPTAEFITLINEMSKAGIKGSDAGTSLKTMLQRLQAPTDDAASTMQQLGISIYDANGRMLATRDIISQFSSKLSGLTEQQRAQAVVTIFGADAQRAANIVLLGGVEAYDKMYAAVTKQGAAGLQAAAQMSGLNGAIKSLQSQVETLASQAFGPLLPLMADFINQAAALAGQLQGPVGAGATALAAAMVDLGAFIQANAIPAMQALAAASAAYALTQVPAVVAAIQKEIAALAAKSAGWLAANAAMVGAIGLYAAVGLAALGAAKELQRFNASLSDGADTLLNSRTWWTDASAAIKQYNDMLASGAPMQDAMSAKMQSAANTVQILKDQIKSETVELAKRKAILEAFKSVGVVDPAAEQAVSDQLAHINDLAHGLENATTYLDGLTGAQQEATAAGMNASAVYSAQRGDLASLGSAAKLTADEINEIAKAIGKTTDEGIQALGEYVNQNVEFTSKIAQSQQEHAAKMAELAADRGKAETDAARAAVDEKIAAEQEGYSKELAAQAAAYAAQEAAQKAHLGQMLIDYAIEQERLGNIDAARGQALREGIKQQYGIVGDTISESFLKATQIIDDFGANTGESAAQAASELGTLTNATVELQQRIAEVQQQRIIEISAKFEKDNNLEAYKQALEDLPSQVATEVQLDNAAANASASDYIRSVHAIPTSVNTVVNATTAPAQAQIADIDRGLRSLPANTSSDVTVNTGNAQGQINSVVAGLNSIPRNVTSTITVQRVEQITSSGIKRASGGFVHGPGSGTSDSIPARLSNGEFVVRASQAQKHAPLLHAINSGVQGFADGGMAGGTPLQSSRGSLELQAPTVSVTAGTTPAAAITAQKAVNDKMLSDLHDYLDDALKAAEDYQKKRLDIEKQFQDDLASQIQENNVSKYESRADFYDSLTSATKDIGQEQAQALAASYEEWYGKARQAEQNGQADLAQQYESYANKRLGSELDYQKKVADLKKDGVTKDEQAEIDRMTAIKTIRDQGMDAELTNIEQGGDKLVKARDSALSEADQAYQDRQQELETKAADAFGKHADAATGASSTVVSAVDAETSAVARLRDALNNLPISKTVSVSVEQSSSTSAPTLIDSLGGAGSSMPSAPPTGGQGFAGGSTRGITKLGGAQSSSSSDPVEIVRQAAAILDVLARNANRKRIYDLKDYRMQLDEAAQILANAASMAQIFSRPLAPIDTHAVMQLAADMRAVDDIFLNSILKNVKSWNYLAGQYKEVSASAISVLKDVAEFRSGLNANDMAPLNLDLITELAGQANQITRAITDVLIPNYSWQANQLDVYHETLSKEVDILKGVADLRRGLADPVPPFDVEQIQALAQQTKDIGKAIGGVLAPIAKRDLDDVTAYADAVSKSTGILSDTAQLARDLKEPTPPISVEQITKLAQETLKVGAAIGGVMVPVAEENLKTLEQFGTAERGAVDILKSVSDLRKQLEDPSSPLDPALLHALANDARAALYVVQGSLLVYTEQAQTELTQYAAMAKDAIDTLNGVAGLRKNVADSGGPLDPAVLNRMAQDAQQATYYVLGAMLVATQETADGLEQYAAMAGNAVGILKDVADLRKDMTDLAGPIDVGAVQRLASEAQQVVRMLLAQLLPTTQEQADALSRYQSAVGSSVSILKDTADLGRDLQTIGPAIAVSDVQRLAFQAQRVTNILSAAVVPTTQEQVDALSRWQDAVGASASIVKDTLGITASMWTDYQSPTDAQIRLIAADADRVVRTMAQAARTYSTDGLTNAKAYADAVGSTFSAFKDGLLFFDALKSGDFRLDQGALKSFESATAQTMATMARLGAQASQIPAADIAAMNAVTSALQNQANALISLSAVPFDNLSAIASALGQGGGGRSISIGAINVYPPEGADAYQTAQYTIAMLNQEIGSYA